MIPQIDTRTAALPRLTISRRSGAWFRWQTMLPYTVHPSGDDRPLRDASDSDGTILIVYFFDGSTEIVEVDSSSLYL